ncbi:hypothetical protein GCM10027578_38990 [Spirosoma luteolum]
MKRLSIFVALVATGVACQSSTVNEALRADASGDTQPILVNRRLFAEVPVSNERFCGGNDDCARNYANLQRRLMALNPIIVPDSGQATTLSWQQADQQYRAFMAEHDGEPIVNLFQQLYARALLNQYGLRSAAQPGVTQYYLQHLVSAGSLDFATMTATVAALHGKIPDATYRQLLTQITDGAQAHQAHTERLLALMTKTPATGTAPRARVRGELSAEFMEQARQRHLRMLKASRTDQYISQLRKLQAEA